MNATQDTSEGWACSDCIMWLANGEAPTELDEDERAAWLGTLSTREVTIGRMFADDCDCAGDREAHAELCESRSFSYTACDHCGSGLGGDRHAVTYWIAS